MRVLVITGETLAEIAEAVKRAEAHPLPLAFIKAGAVAPGKTELNLADRKPGFERPLAESVLIPMGYRANFSVEEQPIGLCDHLSVSVDDPARVPSPDAVLLIAKAYGMAPIDNLAEATVWLEEFEPGHRAVNLVTPRAGRP